jgi:hypothetical protein
MLQGGAFVLIGFMIFDAHPEFVSLAIGLCLILFGLCLRLYVKSYPAPLLTDNFPFGPYRYMRHPLTSGTGMLLVGAAVATRSSWGLFAILGFGAALLPGLLGVEAALERRFGSVYRTYRLSTTRLFPSFFPLPVSGPAPAFSIASAFIRPNQGEWKWWLMAAVNYGLWCLLAYKPEWKMWSYIPASAFIAFGLFQMLSGLRRLFKRRTA